jgi:hypothetical protein
MKKLKAISSKEFIYYPMKKNLGDKLLEEYSPFRGLIIFGNIENLVLA